MIKQNGQFDQLSIDHKPNNPQENERILAAGGFVSNAVVPRVNGILAVSRAFGDKNFKKQSDLDSSPVSSVPEIQNTVAGPGDILFLASDGVFEPSKCSSQWVTSFIKRQMQRTNDISEVAKLLIRECYEEGSTDNITVILIHFNDSKKRKLEEIENCKTPEHHSYDSDEEETESEYNPPKKRAKLNEGESKKPELKSEITFFGDQPETPPYKTPSQTPIQSPNQSPTREENDSQNENEESNKNNDDKNT